MEGLDAALVERDVQESCNRRGRRVETSSPAQALVRMPVPSQVGHIILGFHTQPQYHTKGCKRHNWLPGKTVSQDTTVQGSGSPSKGLEHRCQRQGWGGWGRDLPQIMSMYSARLQSISTVGRLTWWEHRTAHSQKAQYRPLIPALGRSL